MTRACLRLAAVPDRDAAALCGTLLVGAVLAIVLLRCGFGTGFLRLQDAAACAFAALLILSAEVRQNSHGARPIFLG